MRSDRYVWRYLLDGKVVHALADSADRTAHCGVGVFLAGAWYGTGMQAEYDRAAALPECKNCLKAPGANA